MRAACRSHSCITCSCVHFPPGNDGEPDIPAPTEVGACVVAATYDGDAIDCISAYSPEIACSTSFSKGVLTAPSTARRIGPPALTVAINTSTPSPLDCSG